MEITATPAQRSSAYREALFTLSALETENIDLEIREDSQNLLLGKKRLRGQTSYSINVSNYAQRLLDVTPLRGDQSFFDVPEKRMTTLRIQAGETKGYATLVSGLQKILFFDKLSKAPDRIPISPDQGDEIALFSDDSALYADIVLDPELNGNQRIRIAEKNKQTGLCAFYLSMPHVCQKITEAGWNPIEHYRSFELQILTEYDELVFSRIYSIQEASSQNLRLCWWNYFGQIDYFSFKIIQTSLLIDKQRIYTDQGYKTTGCQTETVYNLSSDYLNEETMLWLQEIAAAPKVWIDRNQEFLPVEILSQELITGGEKLPRLDIQITPCLKNIYQHL